MTHADVEYLEAKRTVDDRALAPRVRDRLFTELPANPRILDAGAGTGVTVARLLDGGVTTGSYLGVDRSATVVDYARDRRAAELDGEWTSKGFRVDGLTARFAAGDVFDVFEGERADLVVAQSFLDLVPVQDAITLFERVLRPGGLLYAPLTFDGTTIFRPDHKADNTIETAYHEHIASQPGRNPYAGRRVLDILGERSGRLLSVASSDWIVRPIEGRYPANERQFLATILDFVETAVADLPEATDWLATRRRQLDAGLLRYVAHQYDFLYRARRD